jgi:nucleoside-diphosphate kinase
MASRPFFLMIKPDGIRRGLVGEILSRFEKRGFSLLKLKMINPEMTSKVIETHYQTHSDKSFYDELIQFILSGPIIAMIWLGNVQVAKGLVGDTLEAEPGTIRGDLASSLPENLVHCSASQENAAREINLWRPLLEEIDSTTEYA